MKFSCRWLADYVELPDSGDALARLLTAGGLAVEGVEAIGDDTVLDVDVTTNRPDAMCHFGLAREIAVLTGKALVAPAAELPEPVSGGSRATVTLEDPAGCRRYVARVARGLAVRPSPEWMQRRLAAIGLRPINNVVDATNYVLWELGQPLHAFDLAALGADVVVRRARRGETLVTLDGQRRELGPDMLVIADRVRPVALAGVMGGEATEVGPETTAILLESAWFDPAAVRGTARALGMHTDASHRFERGTDPDLCLRAADRCLALLVAAGLDLAVEEAADVRGEAPPPRTTIAISPSRISALAGHPIADTAAAGWLRGLGFDVEDADGRWRVTAPSWRRLDVLEEADVVEEVLRVHGYDTIPSALPPVTGVDGGESAGWRWRREARAVLVAAGLAEAIDYAFYGDDDDASIAPLPGVGPPLALENPLSERYRLMRRSLLPPLVASARFNQRRNLPAVRLYELGHVFWRDAAGEPREREHLAVVLGGRVGTPWDRHAPFDVFDLKGIVEELADAAGTRLRYEPAEIHGLVPGVAARLVLADGRVVGHLGQLSETEEGPFPLFVVELATAALPLAPPAQVEAPSRYPGVTVDLTFTHPLAVPWEAIEGEIGAVRPEHLESFRLKDRYQGEGVPAGAVNTTIEFVYNAGDRSLTRDEVTARHEELRRRLVDTFGGEG